MADQEKAKRASCKRSFTRSEKVLTSALAEAETPLETIKRRFTDLKKIYCETEKAHDAYLEALDNEANEQQEETWIEDILNRFYELEINYDKKVKEMSDAEIFTAAAAPAALPAVIAEAKKNNSIQLERMRFQPFDGNIRKYPRFKVEFEMHIKPLCDAKQLPFVLKSYLCEDLREDIESLGDNIADMWDRLDRRFGNQSRLVDTILADVKTIQYCNDDDNLTLDMIKTIERCYCDLRSMKRESEMNNTTIISMIEEKMPSEMTNEWIKTVTKGEIHHTEKFKMLRTLLDEWRNRIEYKIANIRKTTEYKGTTNYTNLSSNNNYNKNKNYNNSNDNSMKSRCWVHKTNGEHPIWCCRLFQMKPLQERIELVKENKACYSCLEIGHTIATCQRNFKCTEENCGQRHNKLLHDETQTHQNFQLEEKRSTTLRTQLPIQ